MSMPLYYSHGPTTIIVEGPNQITPQDKANLPDNCEAKQSIPLFKSKRNGDCLGGSGAAKFAVRKHKNNWKRATGNGKAA